MVVPNRSVEYCGICEIISHNVYVTKDVSSEKCELLKSKMKTVLREENVANKIQTFLPGRI